jgi:transposase-like protein
MPRVFIGAIAVKVRDGQVASRAAHAAIGVSLDGERDMLGLQCLTGREGARFWMAVTAGIKNRGMAHGPVCCLCRSRAAASASESRCSAGSAWCQTYDLVAGLPAGLPGPDGRSEHP